MTVLINNGSHSLFPVIKFNFVKKFIRNSKKKLDEATDIFLFTSINKMTPKEI